MARREIVGSPEALDLALNLVRVGGIISSCGLQHKELKINGLQLYLKNVVCVLPPCRTSALNSLPA
jgi:threonine dehydrogenase-like Zn-dependent dehydrogenase